MPIQMQMTLPDLPKNYEYTGEIRQLYFGDWYMKSAGEVLCWNNCFQSVYAFVVVKPVRSFVPFEISKMGERFDRIRAFNNLGHRIEVERAKVIAMQKTAPLERPSFTIEYGKGITVADVTHVEVQ